MIKRVLMVAVGSLLLVACGPGAKIDGKQGAAEALLAASQPTKSATDTGASPVDLSGGVTWNCPEGGSAEIKGGSLSIGTGGVTAGLTLKYNACGLAKSDVGVAVFNGSMTFSQNVMASSSGVGLDQAFKGRLTVQGAYDDFIDADVKQIINVGDLGTTGKGVSMSLKGTITTSENTFAFDEMLTVMAGTISAKVSTSKQ